jgi:ribulose-bisphosphate carboxylase large chain
MYRVSPQLSGERFQVLYQLQGDYDDALAKARDICIEQSVEFPEDLLPPGDIPEKIIGRVEDFKPLHDQAYSALISFAVEDAGDDLIQLLNVIFGNISIKPGIRVEKLILPESLLLNFRGPRFGRAGLRKLFDAPTRPLLCTALKPMGLGPVQLAEQAYKFAMGGIDIIKDDHGLANQVFAPFEERVKHCAEAVAEANLKTGYKCIYMPSLGTRADKLVERAHFAKQHGAGGLLVPPAMVGYDSMRMLADDDTLALPIIAHPAFIGSYVTSLTAGISHYALFGQIVRLAGADATIYPNYGGRFSFSKEECISIVQGSQTPMGHIAPIFPSPGGGMTMDRVPDMLAVYGKEVVFLMGGGLHRQTPDLIESSRYFRNIVENM